MKFTNKLFGLLLVIFCGIACSDPYDLSPIDSWQRKADFPGVARASATAFVVGNKGYLVFGRTAWRSGYLKELWEYDSEADRWKRLGDFPGRARVKGIAGVIGSKAYLGLGCVSAYEGNQFNDLWEYDTETKAWKQMASFPGEARTELFCAVIDSCLYVSHGFTATGFNADTYKYTPATNSWTQLKNSPGSCTCVAGFSIGSAFYAGTGFDTRNNKKFYAYAPSTNSWSAVADVPEARILSKGLSIKGRGYVMLGRYWQGNLDGGKLLKDIIEYNPLTNTWRRCGDFPGGGRQNMVVFAIAGKGYVVGGEDDTERKNDVWMFEP